MAKKEPKSPKDKKEKKEDKSDKGDKRKAACAPEGSQPSRAEVSGMLGHLKYHKDSDSQVAEALQSYYTLDKSDKVDFYYLYKKDKSCKWMKTFKKTTTTSESTSSGFIEGVCNQFEIGKLEGIPNEHPNWQLMIDDICKDLECVEKNDKFPQLAKYKFSKLKLKDHSHAEGTNTSLDEETDLSKKKDSDLLATPGVVIKEEVPEFSTMMTHMVALNKKVGMVNKALVVSRKLLSSFKAIIAKTDAMLAVNVEQLSQGLTAANDFCFEVEDLAAVVKACPCNNENLEINGLITKIVDAQSKGEAFLGAMQVAQTQIKEVMPKTS